MAEAKAHPEEGEEAGNQEAEKEEEGTGKAPQAGTYATKENKTLKAEEKTKTPSRKETWL